MLSARSLTDGMTFCGIRRDYNFEFHGLNEMAFGGDI